MMPRIFLFLSKSAYSEALCFFIQTKEMPISSIVASSETGIESQIPVTPANCGIIQNTGIRKTKPLNKAKAVAALTFSML